MSRLHLHRIVRCTAVAAVAASLLVSCGSSSGSQTPKVDLGSITCAPAPESGFGEDDVCVDSGIRSESLFSFANWGGRRYKADDFGFQEMIALYGESVVCAKEGASVCDVSPKARMLRSVIDNMLQNGRCEGLSALGALYMTSRGPAPEKFGAQGVQSLNPANDDFTNIIDYWWSTQILDGVLERSKSSRKSGVSGVLQTILDGLSSKKGVTVALYVTEGAHSVLPVAVTRENENTYVAHVWDSNNPRALGRITFDLSARTWTYEGGRVNAGSTAKTWTGGDGSIDAVALDARSGKPLMDLGKDGKGSASITASTSSSKEISLTVTTADGKELVATSTGTTGAIPGAEVTPLRTGDVNQVLVTLPEGLTGYSVSLAVTGGTAEESATSQLTVDTGGARALSVVVPEGDSDSAVTVESTTNTSGAVSFTASSPQPSVVAASTDASVLSVPLAPKDDVTISEGKSTKVDSVVVIDPANGAPRTVEVALPSSGTQDVVLVRTTDGEFTAIATKAVPVEIDRQALAAIVGASTQSATSAEGSSAPVPNGASTAAAISNFVGAVTDTAAAITTRITSETAGTAWLEYGPDENWSEYVRTSRTPVESGVETEVPSSLQKLIPGTTYRFRAAFEIDGFVVYSAYSTLDTTGDAPDTFGTVVSDSSVKVTSSLVAATNTGGVIASKVTAPVASRVWIEYVLDANPGEVQKTEEQAVKKGTDVQVVSVLNGLTTGQTYRYRVVVRAQNATGYSAEGRMTTGTTVATEKLNVTAIGSTFTFTVDDVTTTTATVNALVTAANPGRVQAEILGGASTANRKTASVSFAAGKNVKVAVSLTGLVAGTRYNVRILVTSGGVTQYGQYRAFTTSTPESTDTSGGRLDAPTVPSQWLRETEVAFQGNVRAESDGAVYFEFGIDNSAVDPVYKTSQVSVAAGTRTVGPVTSNPVLRAGTPYRVRTVLVIGTQTYKSAYTRFVAAGTMNYADYRASTPNLRRSTDGAAVSWSVGVPDVPSSVTFKVLDGTTVLCSVDATKDSCDATINEYGTRSIVVVSYLNDKEIARSAAGTITIGGTPTVSAFTFVTATSSTLSFTYSFNPRGETVQYGIEVRNAQDQFVKAALGGTTSSSVNGGTQQVTGLTTGTTYRVRMVLIYGSLTAASDWMTVTTQ